ncbi:MAG: DUF2791 family P-loop domain-containing protein [Calothrix sp. MO_167.B12]|nr:DUF2791 family P-loop domain-containing protein [Calothrix sp. MO_167.B12]
MIFSVFSGDSSTFSIIFILFFYFLFVLLFFLNCFVVFRVYRYIIKKRFLPGGFLFFLISFIFIKIFVILIKIPRSYLDLYSFYRYYEYFIQGRFIQDAIAIPLLFVNEIIPVFIGSWVALIIYQKIVLKNDKEDRKIELAESVSEILDSENFLTVLRSSLPRGEEDKEYGLDYIPYMLNDNESRLEELKKSTRFYFILTLCVGIMITIVVVYFGYLLVNEQSAGTGRTLVEINRLLEQSNKHTQILVPEPDNNLRLLTLRNDYLKPLRNFSLIEDSSNDRVNDIINKVKVDISKAEQTNEWKVLSQKFYSYQSELFNLQLKGKERDYLQLIRGATEEFRAFVRSREYALPQLINTTEALNKLIEKVEGKFETEDSRTTELIKRLGLSLIVSTFLLAVLRYISSIYREHYRDMRRVQHEGQIIRRFYIALKSSFKSQEGSTPNQIIANFVDYSDTLYQKDNLKSSDELKGEFSVELIKELLSVLSKRIK